MAISGFGRGKGDSQGQTPAASTSSSSAGFGNLTAFIDQGSEFEGKLSFKDTVRIDGTFRGEIQSDNTLIVGETGEIDATIRSNIVVVSGAVVGDIFAKRQVTLHKNARVEGNVETASLVVEEGAIFNGKVTMAQPGAKSAGPAPLKAIKGGPPAGDTGKAKASAGE